jgi:hypothetical protein
VPKRFSLHVSFEDQIGVLRHARFRRQFDDLADHIVNGWDVPDDFYRVDVDQNIDRLLQATGVKHLHLDGRTSDILVYLVELADQVIVLLIANHAYLQDRPRGKTLREIFGFPW